MCGIAGVLRIGNEPPNKAVLRAMCDVIMHRGPDEEGLYVDNSVGLGSRRLRIIDLSTGQQPVHNEDKTVWAVFNGEIYNFRELRDELRQKGHQFYTNVDTEVIVHAYEEYGEDFVEKLNGMFAIALWDVTQEKLLLVRDRLGIKPLCYFLTSEKLVFGSEIKSILVEGSIERKLSPFSLDCYLTFGYIPAPWSIFEGIEKLRPGHLLSCKAGVTEIRQYWDVPLSQKSGYSESYYQEQLFELLEKAVRRRLISDVPLGAFLSGGMDSGTVVAMMSRLMDQPVKTFSIGFEEEEYSELEDARIVAHHFSTQHTEFMVRPKALELLPRLIEAYDEPFGDSSAIPTYYVSQLARDHVIVALSGDGGDELFGGYRRYLNDARDNLFDFLPRWIRTGILGAIGQKMPMFSRGKSYFQYISRSLERRYLQRVGICSPEMKGYMYTDAFCEQLSESDPIQWAEEYMKISHRSGLLPQMLYADLKTYLPNDLLTKVDIVSMVHSLEVRVPFLDHELVEFAAKIPPELKIRGEVSKYILKQTVSGVVPPSVLKKKKQGFALPLAKWFRGELKEFAQETLTSTTFKNRGLFAPDSIEKILQTHQKGMMDCSAIIWALIFFELWNQAYLDKGVFANSSVMAVTK